MAHGRDHDLDRLIKVITSVFIDAVSKGVTARFSRWSAQRRKRLTADGLCHTNAVYIPVRRCQTQSKPEGRSNVPPTLTTKREGTTKMANSSYTLERPRRLPLSPFSLRDSELAAALQAARSMPVSWWHTEGYADADEIGGVAHQGLHMTQVRGAAIGDLSVYRSGDSFEAEVLPTAGSLGTDTINLGLFPTVEAAVEALRVHVRRELAWDVALAT